MGRPTLVTLVSKRYTYLCYLQQPVQVMLLCGSDLVESFLKPGVWKPDHLEAILRDHGVVCITRYALGSIKYDITIRSQKQHLISLS